MIFPKGLETVKHAGDPLICPYCDAKGRRELVPRHQPNDHPAGFEERIDGLGFLFIASFSCIPRAFSAALPQAKSPLEF